MIVVPTEAYPLSWPAGVPRSSWRAQSKFVNRGIGEAVDDIRRQLKNLRAKTVVISSNLPLRSDGVPRADGPQKPGGDVGVAVYWTREEKRGGKWTLVPYCMPCDKWNRIADNLHAIALSIDALRGMERWGAVTVEQAFAGFSALPPGSAEQAGPAAKRAWWEVFDVDANLRAAFTKSELLAVVKTRHRERIKRAHPDAGGSHELAAELNTALAEAEQELTQ